MTGASEGQARRYRPNRGRTSPDRGQLWKHKDIAPDYRTAVSLARSMSKWTSNRTVYVFKTIESTLSGIVWRYSLVEPLSRESARQ